MLKYRHPLLGRSQRLIFQKGSSVGGLLVSELELDSLTRYLNEAKTESQKRILAILQMMLELIEAELIEAKPTTFSDSTDEGR